MSTSNGQPSVNGHGRGAPPGAPAGADGVEVRVHRVKAGTVCHVRLLGYSGRGCWTHYARERSHYCAGVDCSPTLHKVERKWKGYEPAELWDSGNRVWVPVVLEITEHLECEMRDIAARGQVWELFRDVETTNKRTPVCGKLQEERDKATFPPPFDVRPCLLRVWHVDRVDLSIPNPMPRRVYLPASQGEEPKVLEPAKLATPEEVEHFRRQLRDRNNRVKTPSEQKRG